jgi:hypothetical protein
MREDDPLLLEMVDDIRQILGVSLDLRIQDYAAAASIARRERRRSRVNESGENRYAVIGCFLKKVDTLRVGGEVVDSR